MMVGRRTIWRTVKKSKKCCIKINHVCKKMSFVEALDFAAEKHKFQKRKGDGSPYINHPIGVAKILWDIAEERNEEVLIAAILHDVVEDTDATIDEIKTKFGATVALFVEQVTDDKSLPKHICKQQQVVHMPLKCPSAQLIKLADKLYNCRDLMKLVPASWSVQRTQGYFVWSKKVCDRAELRLCPALSKELKKIWKTGKFIIDNKEYDAVPKNVDLDEFLENYYACIAYDKERYKMILEQAKNCELTEKT